MLCLIMGITTFTAAVASPQFKVHARSNRDGRGLSITATQFPTAVAMSASLR